MLGGGSEVLADTDGLGPSPVKILMARFVVITRGLTLMNSRSSAIVKI